MPTNQDQLPASVHVRKSCVAKSTEKQASMYPKASAEKYDMMSPNSQACVIACAEGVTKVLKGRMATREATAKKRLFNQQQPGTSEQHGAQPKKPRAPGCNNKGQPKTPKKEETLAHSDPDRDGSEAAKSIPAFSPHA